jgi:hypothetical protein
VNPDKNFPERMGGSTRMHDPSEVEHDRVRRRLMNIAFVVIALLNAAQLRYGGGHWLSILLLVIAAIPAGLTVKIFELRFKMAHEERRQILREIPAGKFIAYAALAVVVLAVDARLVTWALAGIWLYDFVTYYHDRPERMRHLYAVTKTLDELRDFRASWAWTLPALAWEIGRRLFER